MAMAVGDGMNEALDGDKDGPRMDIGRALALAMLIAAVGVFGTCFAPGHATVTSRYPASGDPP
jgi:hypothetical protein